MESMRGLFFIVKGSYTKGVAPLVPNRANGGDIPLGCYDPEREDTKEWYMLLDRKTYRCASSGDDLDRILKVLERVAKRHKGDADKYVKVIQSIMPKVSEPMRCLYEAVDDHFGDYFSYEIDEVLDKVYAELREERPVNKSRKLLSKVKPKTPVVVDTPKKVLDTTPKKVVRPKVKIGVKKLVMNE